MIRVAVSGYAGRMGTAVCNAVRGAEDMELVCGIDPFEKEMEVPTYTNVAQACAQEQFDVMVDFSLPKAVAGNIEAALCAGVNCVVGTTGITPEKLEELSALAINDATLFHAPNFTVGAVLAMEFARKAAQFFPEAEVIEMHHCNKKDSPSGTALHTAHAIAEGRAQLKQPFDLSYIPGKETEVCGAEGVRGGLIEGVPVHSVRSMGYVASEEIIFGSMGQTLSIRHDSWDTSSYMPGVLLAVRKVVDMKGLIIGLEKLM